MEIFNLARLQPAEMMALGKQLAPLRSLGDLLDWSRRLEPPVPAPVVVTQDEYTHDVLIPCAGGHWLDFDTT
jgi:hypothetical protein